MTAFCLYVLVENLFFKTIFYQPMMSGDKHLAVSDTQSRCLCDGGTCLNVIVDYLHTSTYVYFILYVKMASSHHRRGRPDVPPNLHECIGYALRK
jgi:hypothetical protein